MPDPIKVTISSLNSPIETVKVMNALAASAVTSVAGRVGDVTLSRHDVGLSNVNNTSDLNKPISTATQNALDLKSDIGHGHIFSEITGLGTAATADTGDFATFSQGALADSALQSGDNISLLNNDAGYLTSVSEHPIQSINGQTGIVVLDADDIDDTSTAHKFASSAQLANADSALQSGDSISLLNNDAGYATNAIQSGDNVSLLVNDAGYITDAVQSGDNISLLVNDENYVSSGDNVSLLVNDAGYITDAVQSGDNISLLVNDENYVSSGDNISLFVNDAGYITDAVQSGDNISLLVNDENYVSSGDNVSLLVNDAGYITDAVQSGDNISLLVNDENYVSSGDNISLFVNDSGYLNEAIQSGDNVSFLTNDALYVASGDNISLLTNDAGYLTSIGTYAYRAETGNYTVAGTDYTINCISGAQTITLPTAVGIQGQVFVVKNSSTGVITITGTASQTIDGYDSIETDFPQSLTLQSTNTNWIII